MKQPVSTPVVVITILAALILVGGLGYLYLGRASGAGKSRVASPYSNVIGPPKSGENRPLPPREGSGRNTITGESLPSNVKPRGTPTDAFIRAMGSSPGGMQTSPPSTGTNP